MGKKIIQTCSTSHCWPHLLRLSPWLTPLQLLSSSTKLAMFLTLPFLYFPSRILLPWKFTRLLQHLLQDMAQTLHSQWHLPVNPFFKIEPFLTLLIFMYSDLFFTLHRSPSNILYVSTCLFSVLLYKNTFTWGNFHLSRLALLSSVARMLYEHIGYTINILMNEWISEWIFTPKDLINFKFWECSNGSK